MTRGGESYHRWGCPKPFLERGFMACFSSPEFSIPLCFSLMKGTNPREQTPIWRFPRGSCGFEILRFPAKYLRFSRKRRESARISGTMRKSVFGLGLSCYVCPLNCSPILCSSTAGVRRDCLRLLTDCRWVRKYVYCLNRPETTRNRTENKINF